MVNKITGAIAILMLMVFLGNYLIKIGSLPLGVVILAVVAMATYDFVLSLREDNGPSS